MKHLKFIAVAGACLLGLATASADITIEECVAKAADNYPLLKKYGILEATREIELSDINKNWLPKIGIYGQVTGQNAVPQYPEALSNVLSGMGQKVEGLSKIQYKIGADINQTIWDGGASSVNRKIIKTREEVSRASLDVELYTFRERVENIYFAILLTEEQIVQNKVTAGVLEANLEKLRRMVKNGVAMQSDCDMVEAQLLTLRQNITNAEFACHGLRRMLELYVGEGIQGEALIIPTPTEIEGADSQRPELKLFEKRNRLNLLSDKITEAGIKPKIGFFAQAYYGYPGFDYFKSMMRHTLSFNLLAGVKISWNIDALYLRKNNLHKTMLKSENINAEKEIFLFNTCIASEQQRYKLQGLQKSMAEDKRIVELRGNVRKAAESQLENGVIDATALLSKIADENIASLNSKLHKIQYLQELYKLKYILNK